MVRNERSTVDDNVASEATNIDWHMVTEAEAASFGLALGLYRDIQQVYEKRRVAWGTALGGVVSMCVLILTAHFVGAGPRFALSIVVASQTIRVLWLWWKAQQSKQDVKALETQALELAHELSQQHPVRQ
jgi:hypothetical protein